LSAPILLPSGSGPNGSSAAAGAAGAAALGAPGDLSSDEEEEEDEEMITTERLRTGVTGPAGVGVGWSSVLRLMSLRLWLKAARARVSWYDMAGLVARRALLRRAIVMKRWWCLGVICIK
jgi:hypothetical protein